MSKYRAFKDSWSVNSFIKRYNNGEINFDNPIQRGVVWNKKDSSLYIHSLLYDILIYQKPFLISKKDNGWDVLDGKQRGTTLINFVNGDLILTGLEDEPLIEVKGELIDINRKRFKHLSDDLQMKILDFQIDIAMLEDAPTEIESLFFKRSNSGRGMTQIDMARSSNTAIETIKEIGKHEIFTFMFSKQMLDRFAQDEIVVKTWQALYEENPDYSLSRFKQVMKELDLTEQHIKQINNAYDMVLDAYKYVCIRSVPIGKAVLRKTHMFCYLPYLKRFSDSKHLSQWMLKFFANMPNEYVQASKDHTTSLKNTQIRNQIVVQSIDDFLKKEAP